ncbi:hypothetical protein SASPL_103314 [Salvia splendens]|uniref:VAN3-binding protein-like auxin canalisation domain-containing protein n=1 Tax=Salvia splendens TaxID=180675 RepID=A0A8X9ADW7_SALSN|nr:hypothetical protein SASPL_103314 [Salvia splendens]
MGSSSEEPSKAIDISVGGLVWIRDPCEAPWQRGCEDWYNLEKSKRVKAFRCGEYDDCIEKAKASTTLLSKKAVKYARREDAILHALELESARLGKDYHELELPSEPNSQAGEQPHAEESPSSSHRVEGDEDMDENLSISVDDPESAPEPSHSGVSFEEPYHAGAVKVEPKRQRTPNDSDDGSEGVKRMRGLEDLGMGVSSSTRRKRSQAAHVHEFLKKRNRRRPLAKVLECTPMLSAPVVSDQQSSPTGSSVPVASESKVSELESNESKINNNLAMNNNSDSTCENVMSLSTHIHADADAFLGSKPKESEISSMLEIPENGSSNGMFDVPLVAEEKLSAGLSTTHCGTSEKAQAGAGAQSSQSSHVETMSLGNEEHNETGSTSSGTADVHAVGQRIEKGTSEWQLKGKRNSRSRKVDMDDEADTHVTGHRRDDFSASSSRNVDPNRVGGSLISDIQLEDFCGWSRNTHKDSQTRGSTAEMATPQRLLPYRQSRLTVNPKYDSSDFSLRHHTAGSGLYDVNVEVKTSYRPEGVPYISLMSKLRGQPIIGHPLSIEVLDDGFCDDILGISECYSSSSELQGKLSNAYTFLLNDYDRKPRGRPPNKRRLGTKRPKPRRNELLSKKIRTLSSLTGAHRQRQVQKKKPAGEKLRGPSIACVPLNVVFSRINAALNCCAPHRAATGSAKIEKLQEERCMEPSQEEITRDDVSFTKSQVLVMKGKKSACCYQQLEMPDFHRSFLSPSASDFQQIFTTNMDSKPPRTTWLATLFGSRNETKKEGKRLQTAQLHAALSLTQLAAAIHGIITATGSSSNGENSPFQPGTPCQDMGNVVSSAAALITNVCAEAAESLGADRARIQGAVDSGVAIRTPIDMIAITATTATSSLLRSRAAAVPLSRVQEMLKISAEIRTIMPSGM